MENQGIEITLPEGFYKVYEIEVSWSVWEMDYVQIGAKSFDDLKEHISKIFKDKLEKKQIKELKSMKEDDTFTRIKLVENVYTTTPYKILAEYAYYE